MSLELCGRCRNYVTSRQNGRWLGCGRGVWKAPAGWNFKYELAEERARKTDDCKLFKSHPVGKRSYWN